MVFAIPLWFQITYPIWQFVRSAKLFKLFYGLPYHLFLYLVRKIYFPPFKKVNCCIVKPGKKYSFAVEDLKTGWESEGLITADLPKGDLVGFGNFKYIIPATKRHLLGDLFMHKPDVLTLSVDYITEGFCIVNYDDQKKLLEMTLNPNIYISHEFRRVLLYPSEDSTLNQNFVRILSIGPLVFSSRGMPVVSSWFTIALVVADLVLNSVIQSMVKKVQRGLVFAFRGIIRRVRDRRNRYSLSLFLNSVSNSMSICDTLAGNFYDLEPGSLVLLSNFADPSYCKIRSVNGIFEESALTPKPRDTKVSEAFKEATRKLYPDDLTDYVEVETKCGTVYMGYNHDTRLVCVFPVNYQQNYHFIQLASGDYIDTVLSILGFINTYKSNIVDISSDGYAHSVTLEYLVNNVAEFRSCKMVEIRRKITVAGS